MDIVMNDPTKVAVSAGKGVTPISSIEPLANLKAMEFNTDMMPSSDGDGSIITTDKGITISQTPSDVKPLEVEAKKEVKVEDKTKVAEQKKEEKKPESILQPPKEEKKEEVKIEDEKKEVKTPADPKTVDKLPITKVTLKEAKKEDDTFDYTKYAPAEVTNLKNMSRQSREAYAKLIDENKSLASLKDSTYLQHEQGYTLAPEYQELSIRATRAQIEAKAWRDALLNIRQAKPFKAPTAWDANGNIVLGEEMQPSEDMDIRVSTALAKCGNVIDKINGEMQSFPQQFKGRIAQDLQQINEVRKEKFSWVADPKLLEHTLEVNGDRVSIKDIKNNFKSMFPSYLQNNPATEVASDLMVSMMIQNAELLQAREGQQVATIKQAEAIRGEPTSELVETVSSGLGGKGVPKTFSLENMPNNG